MAVFCFRALDSGSPENVSVVLCLIFIEITSLCLLSCSQSELLVQISVCVSGQLSMSLYRYASLYTEHFFFKFNISSESLIKLLQQCRFYLLLCMYSLNILGHHFFNQSIVFFPCKSIETYTVFVHDLISNVLKHIVKIIRSLISSAYKCFACEHLKSRWCCLYQ